MRSVTLPLDAASQVAHRGWAVTLAVMVALALAALGLVFLVVQALRASIDMMAKTNDAYNRFVPHEFLEYLNKKNIIDVQLNDNIETEMLKALADYNVEHQKAHNKPLSIGVGVHKGRVRLGTIGESGRMDGTVISDAVNLASRIEGLTKFYGVQCRPTGYPGWETPHTGYVRGGDPALCKQGVRQGQNAVRTGFGGNTRRQGLEILHWQV